MWIYWTITNKQINQLISVYIHGLLYIEWSIEKIIYIYIEREWYSVNR